MLNKNQSSSLSGIRWKRRLTVSATAFALLFPITGFCAGDRYVGSLVGPAQFVEDFNADDYQDILETTEGATHEWVRNGGWKGSGAAKFHPPTAEGYSGLRQFTHINGDVGTEQLNVRFLIYHGSEWDRVRSKNKVVVMNRDGVHARPMLAEWRDPDEAVPRGPRTYFPADNTVGIFENGDFSPDGTASFQIGSQPSAHMEEWISVELEANVRTGLIRLYITTQDGEHSGLFLEKTIKEAATGPGTQLINYIDLIGGYFNDGTPYNENTYYKIDELVMDDSYIGPPDGFTGGANTIPENSYISLNPRMVSARVMSLADNNTITAGDTTLNLDLYERGVLRKSGERAITPGMVISGTGPFDIGSGVSATDTPAHVSMMGRQFVMPHIRYNHTYHMISPQDDATVQLTLEGTPFTQPLRQGEVFDLEIGKVNGNVGTIISSDQPILVSHTAQGNSDASPVPPAATELWGVCSGRAYVSAAEDNTQLTVYSSLSSTSYAITLDAGEKRYVCPTPLSRDERTQGRGPAIHIVSNNKPIGAVQIADGDGVDQTAFYPTSLLNSRFGIPKDTQYIAIACTSADTEVTLYRPDRSPVTKPCNASGNRPGKINFGSPTNGTHIPMDSYLESTRPIYVIYEMDESEDEHNLIGAGAL